jgi:hypothetical protein
LTGPFCIPAIPGQAFFPTNLFIWENKLSFLQENREKNGSSILSPVSDGISPTGSEKDNTGEKNRSFCAHACGNRFTSLCGSPGLKWQ